MESITLIKKDGTVEGLTRENFDLALDLMRNGRYTITFKREREGSTNAQLRLLWMWVNAIARETGDKADDIYKWLCHEMLPHEVSVMGERVTVDGSPNELTKPQMTAFLDLVRNYVRQWLGIRLPLPEDKKFEEFAWRYG